MAEAPESRLLRLGRRALPALVFISATGIMHGKRVLANLRLSQWEDEGFLLYSKEHLHTLMDVFTHPSYWTTVYRPLSTNLYYFLGQRLFDDSLVGYHLVLLATYILNTLLLYGFLREFSSRLVAGLAVLVFITRPSHAEVLLYSSQFQSLLPVTFSLLFLMLFAIGARRGFAWPYLGGALVALGLALMSKESAATIPILAILFLIHFADKEALRTARRRVFAYVAAPVILCVLWFDFYFLVAMRYIVEPGHHVYFTYSPADILDNFAAYVLSSSRALMCEVELYHFPCALISDCKSLWFLASSPGVESVIMTFGLVVVAWNFARYRFPWLDRHTLRLISFGFLFFAVTLVPQVLFFGRLLLFYGYPSSAGFSLCAAAVLSSLVRLVARNRPRTVPGARGQ